jgi:Xaa-Pro dipeptidase
VRAVKTEAEIKQLERAAAIAEVAAAGVFESVRSGVTAGAAAQDFRARVATEGADFDHFALGPRGLGFTAGGPITLEHGDAMYVDFGCVADGWFSDSGTTLSLGDPAPTTLEQFAAVRDCVTAGGEALRPGQPASAAQAAMRGVLSERDITESFPHGHGLGIGVRDLPLVMADNGASIRDECVDVPADLVLEPGMVINLEAAVLTPGVRSVHCERTFVVTESGNRPLVHQDRDGPVLCDVRGK